MSEPIEMMLVEAAVRRKGGAYEVTIVREGPGNAADRRFYTKQALQKAVADGKFEGLQAYLNHPTRAQERDRPERDVTHLAGHFKEARFVDGAPAEVRAKFIPGGMDKDRVVALIESALDSPSDRPLAGISIDGYGDTQEQTIGGRKYHVVREVTHLGSADIVTKAGAGGRFRRRLEEAERAAAAAHDQGAGGMACTYEEAVALERLDRRSTFDGALLALSEAEGESNLAKSRTMVRGALASLREVDMAEPGSVSGFGLDVDLLDQLAREVGDRGFLRNRKSIREALADGSLSLTQFADMDDDDRRAYNERVSSLWDVLGLDREELS